MREGAPEAMRQTVGVAKAFEDGGCEVGGLFEGGEGRNGGGRVRHQMGEFRKEGGVNWGTGEEVICYDFEGVGAVGPKLISVKNICEGR